MFRKKKRHKRIKDKFISTKKSKKKNPFGMDLSAVISICENIPLSNNIKVIDYQITKYN